MKKVIFFVLSFGISLCYANFEAVVLRAHQEKIESKNRKCLWIPCIIIQELGLPPITPCSSDKKGEQLLWLIEQRKKDYSSNILD